MENGTGIQLSNQRTKPTKKIIGNSKLLEIMDQLSLTETHIIESLKSEDVNQAKLRLESGKYLLKAKKIVKDYGKNWEVEIAHIIPKDNNGLPIIKKTSRCERMKVAQCKNIEKYLDIGWKKLVKLASLIEPDGVVDIEKILAVAGFTPEIACKASLEDFSLGIDIYYELKNLKKQGIKIGSDLIRKCVQQKVKFDKKLYDTLKKTKRPDLTLKAKIHFDVTNETIKKEKPPESYISEIEETIEKLIKLMSLSLTSGPFPSYIPLYMYDDLVHYASKMYNESKRSTQNKQNKNNEEGTDICEFINHLLQ